MAGTVTGWNAIGRWLRIERATHASMSVYGVQAQCFRIWQEERAHCVAAS